MKLSWIPSSFPDKVSNILCNNKYHIVITYNNKPSSVSVMCGVVGLGGSGYVSSSLSSIRLILSRSETNSVLMARTVDMSTAGMSLPFTEKRIANGELVVCLLQRVSNMVIGHDDFNVSIYS